MKIIKLIAQNFKRLEAVEIEPNGNTIYITGKNCSGKTSVLDAIMAALQYPGQKKLPKPVREGSDKAEIQIDLGDMLVTRTFTDHTTRLEVTNKQNMKFTSPQAVLDKLIGKFTFDPTVFYHMEPKFQKDFLLEAMGLGDKLGELETKRQTLYDQRTILNRQIKTTEANIPSPKPERVEAVSVTEIYQRIREAANNNREVLNAQSEIDRLEREHSHIMKQIEDLGLKAKNIKEKKITLLEDLTQIDMVDEDKIATELSDAEGINSKAELWNEYESKAKSHASLVVGRNDLTQEIGKIDSEKSELLEKSKFPIDGLSFMDDGVIYQDIPFKQASDSDQLRVSTAIAMALNPDLRIILIKYGSLLDSTTRIIIEEMMDKKDYQAWIEAVDETGKVGIVIEEGKIKEPENG